MSSFTILAFLKVPVSHVPREVYPFVVFVIGLENMFRLINAVLATRAGKSTTDRISSALGDVGFLSSVAVVTDLGILGLLAQFSFPAVREFCLFAAVALVMDFILHLTFFLAALSVDVRRLELQDSIDRLGSLAFNDSFDDVDIDEIPKKPNAITEFLFRGGSPLTTRISHHPY